MFKNNEGYKLYGYVEAFDTVDVRADVFAVWWWLNVGGVHALVADNVLFDGGRYNGRVASVISSDWTVDMLEREYGELPKDWVVRLLAGVDALTF